MSSRPQTKEAAMKNFKDFTFTQFGDSATTPYDLDHILSGKIVQLEAGTDYSCKPQTLLTLARAAATKRGLKLRTSKVENGVVLQAYSDSDNGEEEAPTPPTETRRSKKKSA